jgi:type II secretory pathway component PulC
MKTPAASANERRTDQKVISEEVRVAPETPTKTIEAPPTESMQAPRSLRISGIVWSEAPSSRLAVINGASLTEGSVIEGVKVVEIFPTHVRFLHKDRPFEIPLGSSKPIND